MDIEQLVERFNDYYYSGCLDYKFPDNDLSLLMVFFQDIAEKLLIMGTEYNITRREVLRSIDKINSLAFARTLK